MTEPVANLLSRTHHPDAGGTLNFLSDTLEECVNFGTHVISWGNASSAVQQHAPGVLVMLTRLICECIDGISVLVRASCPEAAKPLLRSAVEGFLSVDYVCESDTERRAQAYQVHHAHERISLYERLNPRTETGKQLRSTLERDVDVPHFNFDQIPADPRRLMQNLLTMLSRPEFAPIEAEWQRMRDLKKGALPWYALFGGPTRLEHLATRLRHVALYELAYRNYSATAHMEDALRHVVRDDGGGAAIVGLRQPRAAQQVTSLTIGLALKTFRRILRTLAPQHEASFSSWYLTELRPRYMLILDKPLIPPAGGTAGQ